jgi:RNA-directed DNA polymerase
MASLSSDKVCRASSPVVNGFRPGRSQHDALEALYVGITSKKVNGVLDLDIRSFFDKVSHEGLVQFVEQRIQDQRIVRLIQKWLKAGVMEDGQWFETEEGTPDHERG